MVRARSIFRVAWVIPLLVLAACSGASAPEEQGGGAVLVQAQPAAMRAPGWLEFKDLSVHTDAEKGPPREPYIRGAWIGTNFDATAEISGPIGDPPKGRNVSKGWLELRTRSFFRADDPRPRTPPYVPGFHDDDTGGFFPGSAVVWSVP